MESTSDFLFLLLMEEWRIITDFPQYQISNFGRVRRGNRLLNPCFTYSYFYVSLSVQGKKRNRYVHRLVAQAFVTNPHNKKIVIHIDGDVGNNRADNLRWVTHQRKKIEARLSI